MTYATSHATPQVRRPRASSKPIVLDESDRPIEPFALVSHESAVEAIWALGARRWQGVLDDENIWQIPAANICVTTQGDFVRLASAVDLNALGIVRRPVDLLVPNRSCYSRGKQAKFHVWKEFFPPHSFVRIHHRVFVSTPYFAALQLAMACRPNRLTHEEAAASAALDARLRNQLGIAGEGSSAEELTQWANIARLVRATQVVCDFMGTYRYVPPSSANPNSWTIVYKTKPLAKPRKMDKYLDQMGSVRGIRRARKAVSLSFAKSASPMETMLALMLTLPHTMGGFGLPRPKLNEPIDHKPYERALLSQEHFDADLCWPEQRVIVEYYGWKEHFGKGPHKVATDLARANSLTALGWTVFLVTYEQIKTVAGISLLANQVAKALKTTLPELSELELVWRSRLLAMLLPKTTREP